ncbi:hypothetical protein MYAM1_002838 [Malassezia yamatoensis]|uniref:Sds3-like protein n=1 Tax=Malassezia yamatoensis TaxID=253288 RepID=A0AAJ6CJT6_9BASI|nr:hypothetical protein MYAM1_002838 [Malassezia yamatoensis]
MPKRMHGGDQDGLHVPNPHYAQSTFTGPEIGTTPYMRKSADRKAYGMHEPTSTTDLRSSVTPPRHYLSEPVEYLPVPHGAPDGVPVGMRHDPGYGPMPVVPHGDPHIAMDMPMPVPYPMNARDRTTQSRPRAPGTRAISPHGVPENYEMRPPPRHMLPHGVYMADMLGVPVSKRDRKRREVLDRLEHARWEGLENRDALFHEAYASLTATYQTLLTHPSHVREYSIAVADLTLDRNAALREIALDHAFRKERSEMTYAAEHTKLEDEARLAKRSVKDKLFQVLENRKRRLCEEKEGGELTSDSFLESSQRPHSTRQLRNKSGTGAAPTIMLSQSSHLGQDEESDAHTQALSVAVAQLLHWTEADAAAAISDASASVQSDDRALPVTTSNGDTMALSLHTAFSSHTSLLAGVNMSMAAAATAQAVKTKKKGPKTSHGQIMANAERTIHADEEESASPTGQHPSTPFLSTGGGRLRWDTAKCLSQLTGAKDIEIESDLINIHKVGHKRRRK